MFSLMETTTDYDQTTDTGTTITHRTEPKVLPMVEGLLEASLKAVRPREGYVAIWTYARATTIG